LTTARLTVFRAIFCFCRTNNNFSGSAGATAALARLNISSINPYDRRSTNFHDLPSATLSVEEAIHNHLRSLDQSVLQALLEDEAKLAEVARTVHAERCAQGQSAESLKSCNDQVAEEIKQIEDETRDVYNSINIIRTSELEPTLKQVEELRERKARVRLST